ncbi:MAG: glycosylase [Chlorobi bacterium]|nr:glycosylase [Chlorobiota bacterium]
MKTIIYLALILLLIPFAGCKNARKTEKEKNSGQGFPNEMVRFAPYKTNPVFSGSDTNTWDRKIRERGYILLDEGIYKMWYTGYKGGDDDPKYVGYATSTDGIRWKRYPDNPVYSDIWTEDMQVIKHKGVYYMFAEGKNDVAHWLTSMDGIHWKEKGPLDIRYADGQPLKPGPYGTPAVWIENNKWYLFYERNDEAIWLAASTDHKVWTNVQDDPVMKPGPGKYDTVAIAVNQIVKYKGKYYAFYHGTDFADWLNNEGKSTWSSNVAMSEDLIHWVKYPGNPIIGDNHSSPILVFDGKQYRLYTMHAAVWLYFPDKTR